MDHIMIDVDQGSKAVHTDYMFEGEPKPLNKCAVWDDAYQRGLNDAWECARKIILPTGYSFGQLQEAFSLSYPATVHGIFEDFSASEAIAKIKEYEEKNHDN